MELSSAKEDLNSCWLLVVGYWVLVIERSEIQQSGISPNNQ